MAKRRNFTDQFKAKVALEALRGEGIVSALAKRQGSKASSIRELRGNSMIKVTVEGIG